MASPYTSPALTGYNATPPSDDGSTVAANQLTWAKHKTKLADPLRTYIDEINTNVQAAFTAIYGQTAIETSASVTPTNHQYEPGNLLRYGTNSSPGTTDMTSAFQAAAAYLAAGGRSLYIPGGVYLLSSGRFDVDGAPNGCTIYGDGRNVTRIITDDGATQSPFVVRNTDDVVIRGLAFESTAEDSLYQHGCEVMNCNEVTVEYCSFKDAGGYGFGCYEDTVANPDVDDTCNNFVFRFNVVRNASQYGLQHFPKVRSSGCWVYGNLFVDCGENRQGDTVPTEILPSAIKAGQATDNSHVFNNTIFAPLNAAGLDVGNFEDIELYDNQVYNCERQFLAVSVSEHASLTPYVPTHRRMIARDNKFIFEPGAGTRVEASITLAVADDTAVAGIIRFERNYVEGETYTTSMKIDPAGALSQLEIVSPRWRGSFTNGSIVIWIDDAAGGTTTAPLIENPQIINSNLALTTLRAVQIEGAVRPRIIGGYLKNMGENAIDLRNCTGGAVVSKVEIDGYNLADTALVAAIAVTDTAANDYHIDHVTLRLGEGSPKALISASTGTPEFFLGGNRVPAAAVECAAGVNVVERGENPGNSVADTSNLPAAATHKIPYYDENGALVCYLIGVADF